MNKTPVAQILAEMGIPHQEFTHTGAVKSLEQAAAERGQQPEQVVRSLVFRVAEGEYLMALVAGPQQVDWKVLRRELNQNRLTMASREEVLSTTGYQLGAVAPFGLNQAMPIIADPSVFVPEVVSLGSGVRGTAVILKSADLRRALGEVQVVSLTTT